MIQKKLQKKEITVLYILSFSIPVIAMLLILKEGRFYPFGNKSLFIMDMRDQYLEFFASLRYLVFGDDSLFFSWSRSMGGNYLGLFAYYIASPLSFITILFSLENLPFAILFLTILKIGLAGLSFAVFGVYIWKSHVFGSEPLAKKNKCKVISTLDSSNWKVLLVLPFAISYALMSYNMVYSMCLMWLDGVIMLPVVLLGVEKILDGRKGFHYMLALATLFICNYYTGYMVGVFAAIYMANRVLCCVQRQTIREYVLKTLRFVVCTVLAFGISAPVILSVVKDLAQGKLAIKPYVPDIQTNFEFMKLFGKLRNGVYDSIQNTGLPAIYCGYVVIIFALLYFILPQIKIKEKVGAVIILIFLACSFYYTRLDMAWQGFQYPNWFPYRYAFVGSFFLIYMALFGLFGIYSFQKNSEYIKHKFIIIIVLLSIIVIYDLQKNGSAMFKGLDWEFGYCMIDDYENFLNKTKPLVEQAKKDKEFYRINQGYEFSKNDAMLLGYHGMTHYSSTFNASVNLLTLRLGIAQQHIWNSGYGSNQLLDSLFAVKYIIEDGMVPSNYKLIGMGELGGAALYENTNVLPIAYAASCKNANPNLESADPFVNQNTFLNAIMGTQEEYFTEYEYSMEDLGQNWKYTFIADSDNPVYLYMKSNVYGLADVYVNEKWVGNYFQTESSCNLYLGSFQQGEQVVVNVVPVEPIIVDYAIIGQLHVDLLERTLHCLQENGMNIIKHANGKLSGTIHVDDQQKIITSIPFDTGWIAKIDGKKVKAVKFADTFLMLDVPKGDHDIEFYYISPGFGIGIWMFAISVLLAVIFFAPLQKL